jgi:sugar/nucleoside kinase (ribokinase family)
MAKDVWYTLPDAPTSPPVTMLEEKPQMNRYDIIFMGYMGTGTVVPYQGSPFIEQGSPAFFGTIAASCATKRIALVTKISGGEEQLLEPLKAAGIDLFVQPGETAQYRVVFPTANVDQRQLFLLRRGGSFGIDDVPPTGPCLIHLAYRMGMYTNSLEFMRALKARRFRLSVDMQSFVFQMDEQTGLVRLENVPDKKEILSMVDFVKLDVVEAKVLTGADVLDDQADILEDWGSVETVITCSEGALARSKGKTAFAPFTNRITRGRMGRGDTFFGAYLARRLDHSVQESLGFAAALTSIKLESGGPFRGSLEEVLNRMEASAPSDHFPP